MKEMKARKIATGMLVAAVLLSSLVVILPSDGVNAAVASNAQISFNVVDDSPAHNPVVGAVATLTEVHTSKTYTKTSDAGGLVTFLGTGTNAVLPGYYLLTVTKPSVNSSVEYPSIIRFDGTGPVALNVVVLPAATGTISFTVTKTVGGTPVSGVVVKLYDVNSVSKLQTTLATFTGTGSTLVFPGTYKVIVTAPDMVQQVATVTVTGASTTPVVMALDAAVPVTGYVYRDSAPGTGITAYLVSKDTGQDKDLRIIAGRPVGTNGFKFDAYPGNFYMIVDATDAAANMTNQTVLASTPKFFPSVNVTTATGQVDTSDVNFASGDWNAFDLTRIVSAGFDVSVANIAYGSIPNIRMEIDFAYGNGDGTVSPTELAAFSSRVQSFGPQNITSDFVVKVNGTSFMSAASGYSAFAFNGLSGSAGSVSVKAPYSMNTRTHYTSQAAIVNGFSSYTVLGYDKYSTPSFSYVENLKWPSGYEMTSNTTQTSFIKVSGYLNVTIATTVRGTGFYEQVTMGIQKSVAPTAVGGVQVPSNYAYAVTSSTGAVLYYIVSTDRSIVYTANGSSDPNGNPLKYSWDFVGVGQVLNIPTPWTGFTIGAASFNITVVLTVTDVANLQATKTFYIKADGLDPTADFSVVNHTISSGTLNVNQNEAVVFNGGSSFDHIANDTDVGVIKTWVYTWGDGNKTTVGVGENLNVTKTYARPGTFDMSLNVTDAAGHYSIKSIVVVVKDKTPPTPVISVTLPGSTTQISTAQENTTLAFSANGTTDPYVPFSQLNFTWYFGDGAKAYGNYVTHFYQKIATFTVYLNVTNPTANYGNVSKALTITSQARPDLRVVSIVFSPTTFTEGESGTITVNITNVGSTVAGAPYVEFYILQSSGAKTPIGNSSNLVVNGTTPTPSQLKPGEHGTISLTWTPSAKGNYTIFVNAVTAGEINRADNTDQAPVTVNEAAWKAVALYGGIFAVIIVVIVLFYMRRRLPKLPKLGKGKAEEQPKKPSQKK